MRLLLVRLTQDRKWECSSLSSEKCPRERSGHREPMPGRTGGVTRAAGRTLRGSEEWAAETGTVQTGVQEAEEQRHPEAGQERPRGKATE